MEPQDLQVPAPLPDGPPRRKVSGARKLIATPLLSLGMIAVGGVAIVNAASPAPSASPSAPAAGGSGGAPHGGPANGADCPNM